MKQKASVLFALTVIVASGFGGGTSKFDTRWIPLKPEVLTYRTTSPQGEGLYQVSLSRGDSTIQVYLNMISPGFTKTVTGTMMFDMHPTNSETKIVVNDLIIMDTRCSYEMSKIHIRTVMSPYHRILAADPSFENPIVDFSQIPLLARVLPLEKGNRYTFNSINPRTNTIAPLALNVAGEESVANVVCFKVEVHDFEGLSIYWVERGSTHRVMRIEQPESHRVTELMP